MIDSLSTANQLSNFPMHLLTLPVTQLENLSQWMDATTDRPQRQITVHAILAIASVLAGRLYKSTNGNLSSVYLATLAPTGMGKNYAKVGVKQALDEFGLIRLLSGSGNTSSGAVFTALFIVPCHIQVTDEFGKHLQMARKQKNGAMADAFAVLTEAYSDANSVIMPRNQSMMTATPEQLAKYQTRKVESPAITLFAIATPEQVYDNLTTAEIDDGFLNRLVAVTATLPCQPKQVRRFDSLSDELKDWVESIRIPPVDGQLLAGQDTPYNIRPKQILVRFTPDAWVLFEHFLDEIEVGEREGKYAEPKITKRWNENAQRISVGLAACANPRDPLITTELAQWAIDYVRYYGQQFMDAVAAKVADSDFHRLYLEVERLIMRSGLRGMTEGELSTNSRLFKATPPAQRSNAFLALSNESKIQKVTYKAPSGRGKPRVAWVSMDCFEDHQ